MTRRPVRCSPGMDSSGVAAVLGTFGEHRARVSWTVVWCLRAGEFRRPGLLLPSCYCRAPDLYRGRWGFGTSRVGIRAVGFTFSEAICLSRWCRECLARVFRLIFVEDVVIFLDWGLC